MSKREHDDNAGVLELVRDVADGFVGLAAAHLRSSNAELVAELRDRGARLAILLSIAAIAGLGYVFTLTGATLALGARMGRPLAFATVGGAHFGAAAAGLGIALWRKRAPRVQHVLDSMSDSVSSVADTLSFPTAKPVSEQPHAVV
jgi:hypothetical protein